MRFCLLLLLPVLCLTACSFSKAVPGPVTLANEPVTLKQKLRADPQWNALANAVAEQTDRVISKAPELGGHSIYVVEPERQTPITKAFRSMVLTKLVQKGYPITSKSREALFLSYDVEISDMLKQGFDGSNSSNDVKEKPASESNDIIVRVMLVDGEKIFTSQNTIPVLGKVEDVRNSQIARSLTMP